MLLPKLAGRDQPETVAKGYEEYVFRRFGASQAIYQGREPELVSDFFLRSTVW